ncbi:UNVERIFIED_CONTAM: hypothetical protein GTU68_031354 [Idotea baltica]|nr:hypothetical protein [Idotea baltica]
MMIVSFIFIPNPLSSMWVGISILSIQVGVIGYMSLWGVRLDFVSMINLIMSIGFSVDFSAHIVYAYVSSKYQTSKERLKESMYTMGLPIVQSGISTILGVALFVLVPSYVYRTFFKIIFLVTIFGMMHALLVLPVLLSLTSHGFCKSQNNNNEETSKDKKEHRLRHCFDTGSNLREEELNNKYQKRELCNEDSNFSRNSCSSGSNSVQTESLRSSNGSSGHSSKSESKGTQNSGFDSNHDSIEVERL